MDSTVSTKALTGRPAPLGATFEGDGVNFALYSANATQVELCLFDATGQNETARLELVGRTGDVWHGFVPNLVPGQLYGYRVQGPYEPEAGHRFNPNKLLVDPYARELHGHVTNHDANFAYVRGAADEDLSFDTRDNAAYMPKCVVAGRDKTIDTGNRPLTPWAETIIYELHLAGMTRRHPDVLEPLRGTFAGLASQPVIDHIKALGVTAIELLPVYPFADEPHLVEKGLTNYWGYNPYTFFAPEPRYASASARTEMREMVRRFHDAGIEVILDVVYNHSGEGWHLGPTLSLRGIDNQSYYRLRPDAPRYYINDTGCGNTIALDREPGLSLAICSLRHWVEDMGADGFRFDLAATLARRDAGFDPNAPFLEALANDPVLGGTKLIAEPWDVGPGGYQLGEFRTGRFSEWNDRYRSTVRGFWRGDGGQLGELGARLTGSADLFSGHRLGPHASLNYITAHDGFTLNDLVSYAGKHNAKNGEDNRDGTNDNLSANYGAEGPTNDPQIQQTRARQMRNLLATLLFSQGVPMLLAGDEIGHTQNGNNNAYCQDNELSWIDWSKCDRDVTARELLAFTQTIIHLRKRYPALRQPEFLNGAPRPGEDVKDASWWSPDGHEMTAADWQLDFARTIGLHIAGVDDPGTAPPIPEATTSSQAEAATTGTSPVHLLLLFNAHDSDVPFRLPPDPWGRHWNLLLDTSGQGETPHAGFQSGAPYALAARSVVLLATSNDGAGPDASKTASDAIGGRAGVPHHRVRHVEPATLDQLSLRAGIELSYWDLKGRECKASYDTKRALLGAMDISTASESEARDGLHKLNDDAWRRLLSPATVLRLNDTNTVRQLTINLPAELAGRPLAWRITLDNGGIHSGEASPRALQMIDARRVNGSDIFRLALPLPADLPIGMHELSIEIGNRHECGTLVLAPPHAYRPDWLGAGGRKWGLACQLYGLRRGNTETTHADFGIGELSHLADLSRRVGEVGGAALGINPLHALFWSDPQRASPYSPSSRRFLNPLYLDITATPEFASCENAQAMLASMPQTVSQGDLVDYPAVASAKREHLKSLFQRFKDMNPAGVQSPRRAAFDAFVDEGGSALHNFAIFQALEEHLGSPAHWPATYASSQTSAVKAFSEEHADLCQFFKYLQFETDRQLASAAHAAQSGGMQIGLYGDFAVGAAPDGAEAWSEPDAFASPCLFGAPPDPFSDEGQDWGMPPLNPHRLTESGYCDFAALLEANMRHVGALRLDHVMWLERMFWIPEGGTAKDGAYVRYPREDLLGVLALQSHRNTCLVVGEDLGTVPLGFRERMEPESILSYRFLRFERFPDGLFQRPDTYPRIALATPASHDLATLRGFWLGRDIVAMKNAGLISQADANEMDEHRGRERTQLIAALADQNLIAADFPTGMTICERYMDTLMDAVHRFLGRTPSALVMANIEDVAGMVDQANLPGTIDSYPNWQRRLPHGPSAKDFARRLDETATALNQERTRVAN